MRGTCSRLSTAARFLRRASVVVILTLAVSVAVPPGTLPPGGHFPLTWLHSLLAQRIAWAQPSPAGDDVAGRAGRAELEAPTQLPDPSSPLAVEPSASGRAPWTSPDLVKKNRYDRATSVRVPERSTETATTYRNTDGSSSVIVSSGPVNYKAADNTWQPIDTTLVPRPGGRLQAAANSIGVSVSARASASRGRATSLATVTLADGTSVSFALEGAAPVAGEVSGSTTTYRSVLPETDLVLRSARVGLKESVVLRSKTAANSWVFPLTLDGLTARAEKHGSVELVNAAGKVAGVIPAGFMFDSHFEAGRGEMTSSTGVRYELTTVDGGPALRMTADRAWLDDPARVYPVTIDPSMYDFKVVDDVFVDDDGSSAAEQNGDTLNVGTYNGSTYARTFLNFANVNWAIDRTRIAAAELNMYQTYTFSCSNTDYENTNIYRVTEPWSVGELMYGSYPGPAVGGSPIGHISSGGNYPACTNTWADHSIGSWSSGWLDTDTFNDWSLNPSSNMGLAVVGADGGWETRFGWKKFTSADFDADLGPYLRLDLVDTPPQVNYQFPPSGYSAPSLTPELSAEAYDPDNFPAAMTMDYLVLDDQGAEVTSSGPTTEQTWVVPAGKLQWGKQYIWTVTATDGKNGSTSQTKNVFTTGPPQPLVTSGLAQNGGQGFAQDGRNYTTTVTDATVASVGPALALERSYNSLDPRVGSAFGAGWSSIVDAKATERLDAAGALQAVVVTYPSGQEMAFGRNADDTFVPPTGRFATFARVAGGGYKLVDKNGTTYTFTNTTGVTGQFALSTVADTSARAITAGLTAGKVTSLTSASGRAMALTWYTPSGATKPHVQTVTLPAADPSQPTVKATWTYTYTGDLLTKVCPPTSTTNCATYTYDTSTAFPTTVLNTGPRAFWRLGDAPSVPATGPVASSSVLDSGGTDNGTYQDVMAEPLAPLAGSDARASFFNGVSSGVILPKTPLVTNSNLSVALWFKTSSSTGGPLISEGNLPINSATDPSHATIPLYVGTDGKLHGAWYTGTTNQLVSATTVNNGQWHHAVLSAAGNSQRLYLDGNLVNTLAGQVNHIDEEFSAIGRGFSTGAWPAQQPAGWRSFPGSIGEVAMWDRPVTAAEVAVMYPAGTTASRPIASIVRPSGNATAQIDYNDTTGTVKQVTDENGGVWKLADPMVVGSYQVHASAVLGAGPVDYWRLAETGTTEAINSVTNQVNGGIATYSGVTLGVPNGPFSTAESSAGTTVAGFNGTSSHMRMPVADVPKTGNMSIAMWFKLAPGQSGVLFGYQVEELPDVSTDFVPMLYVGTDGKLRGEQWVGSVNQMTSAGAVNDNNWHHVALASTSNTQVLYLDGAQIGSVSGNIQDFGALYAQVGAGQWNTWPAAGSESLSYWPGQIAEVSYYARQLSAAQVSAQFAGRQNGAGGLARTITVTDPKNHPTSYLHDMAGHKIAEVDALGQRTQLGYNKGFLHTVTDPNGNVTTTEQDARGNTSQSTTCQKFATGNCSTVYFEYYPDATTTQLTPDARNDVMTSMRNGRSATSTDNTFKTTFEYDAAGNRTKVIDPLARQTVTTYTTAATPAVGGGTTKAGLPLTVTTAGGAVQTAQYFANGDLARMTDPAGKITEYTYDGVGRMLTQKEITTTFPAGLVTTFHYDLQGRVDWQQAPPTPNRVTNAVHQAKVSYTYGFDSEVKTQKIEDTPAGGDASRMTTWEYNNYGQQIKGTDPENHITQIEYDEFGRIVKETDANNKVTLSEYDAKGHLTRTVLKDFTGNPNNPTAPVNQELTRREYDGAGRLLRVFDALGRTEYTYTGNDLLLTTTRIQGSNTFVQLANTYDKAGNVTQTKTNNGVTTTNYVLDAASRTTRSTVDPGSGAAVRVTDQTLSPDNFVLNTTQSTSAGEVTSTDTIFDPLGRPLATTRALSPGSPVARFPLSETSGVTARDTAGNTPLAGTDTNADGNPDGFAWTGAGSAQFNGAGYLAASAGPVLDATRSFALSAWVYLTDNTAANIAVSLEGKYQSFFDLRRDGSNKWRLRLSADDVPVATGTVDALSSTAPALNTWTHLTGVYDAPTKGIKLYVNGALSGSATAATPFAGRGGIRIGAGIGNGAVAGQWHGQIKDVQLYQKALSVSEIGQIVAGSAPAAGAGVVRTSWKRNEAGVSTQQTDPRGNVTDYELDQAGRVTVVKAPATLVETGGGTPVSARPTTYTGYNTFGEATDTKDANGNWTIVDYNGAGWPVATKLPSYTAPISGTVIQAISRRGYDNVGQVTSETDPNNHVTSYTYDQLGRVVKVTGATPGTFTRFTYDLLGNKLSTVDPNGATTNVQYDFMSRPTRTAQVVRTPSATYNTDYTYTTGGWPNTTKSPSGIIVTTTYNNVGQPLTVNESGATTTFQYDGAGRQTRTTLTDNSYTTKTYNGAGWVTEQRTYDIAAVQRKVSLSSYDAAGNVIAATDPRNNTSTFVYNANGLLTSQTEPVSASASITATFGYDLAGHQTRFTNGENNRFITKYNTWGLPEAQIEPATSAYPLEVDGTFIAEYDPAGLLTKQKSPGNVLVTNTYDEMNRLKTQAGTGADAATAARTFNYDLGGRPTTIDVPGMNVTLGYEDRGLLTSVSGGTGSTQFVYNGDGSMTRRDDAAGTTTYGYNTFGRLDAVTNTTTGVAASLTYNTLAQPSLITYNSGNRHQLDYDESHRLKTDDLRTSGSPGTSIAKIEYQYDGNDNETQKKVTKVGTAGTVTNDYTYDFANRLKTWTKGTTPVVYDYDKAGNRTQAGTITYTYDQRNQLKTSSNGMLYSYTKRGTLSATTTTGVSTLVTKTDAYGQVIYQDTSTTAHRDYTYDGLGRLTRTGASFSGAGNDLATDGTSSYTRNPAGDVIGETNGTTKRLAWTDLHDDIVGQFTDAGTTLTGSTTYDPLGKVLATAGMVGTLGFQSEYTDLSTGRVNMAARWYNTATGQFDTRDTVGMSPTPATARANRFAYADANPLTQTDPSGHWGFLNAIKNVGSAIVNTAVSVVKTVVQAVTTFAANVYNYATEALANIRDFVVDTAKAAFNYVKDSAVGQWIAEKAQQAVELAKAATVQMIQKASAAIESTKRQIAATIYTAADAVNSAKNWVVEHKDLLIEIAAIGAGVLAGIACTAATAGVGALACMAGTAALINVAKDAAQGNIHSIGDVFKSAGTGAWQGAMGVFGGAVGGRLAGMALSKLGGLATGLIGRAVGGALSGGIGDAATQFLTTGRVDLGGVAMAAGMGAVFGAVGGRGGRGGGGRGADADPPRTHASEPAPSRAGGGEGRGGNGGVRCDSFAPSTRVLMADGSTRPIAEVQIGDKVKATDPETGTTEDKAVTELHLNLDHDLTNVTIAAGDGAATLETTQHHPFWDATSKSWVDAADLTPATSTTMTPEGTQLSVVAVDNHPGSQPMLNLTVADTHTYYVVAGDTPVLVHNCNAGPSSRFEVDSNGTATDLRPGLVEGPAPQRAHDMLAMVDARPGGIGKIRGYAGNASYANRSGALPSGVKYREWELYPEGSLPCPRGCGGVAPGTERIVTELGGTAAYYTPDHYGTFFRIR